MEIKVLIVKLDYWIMVSSWFYGSLFMVVFLLMLFKSRMITLRRISINFAVFAVILLARGIRDFIYYTAYEKNPLIN